MRLNKLTLLFTIIISLAIFASCTQIVTDDPKVKYTELIQKSLENQEYKIVYEMDFGILSAATDSGAIKVGGFKKGDKEKGVMEISALGNDLSVSTYILDGYVVLCTKGDLYSTGDQISCQKTNEETAEQLQGGFDDFTKITELIDTQEIHLNFTGIRTIIGRECLNFVMEVEDILPLVDSEQFSTLFGGDEKFPARISGCLDSKTGIALETSISFKVESELAGEQYQDVINMKAIVYEQTVDDSEFEIPVTSSVAASACYDNKVRVALDVFKDYEGDAKVNVLEIDNENIYETILVGTKEIKDLNLKSGGFELLEFELEDHERPSIPELCIGDECNSIGCSVHYPNEKDFTCLGNSENKEACEADSNCYYSDPICEEFSCDLVQEESVCNARDGCEWTSYGSVEFCSADYGSLRELSDKLKEYSSSGSSISVSRIEANGDMYILNQAKANVQVTSITVSGDAGSCSSDSFSVQTINAANVTTVKATDCTLTKDEIAKIVIVTQDDVISSENVVR